MTHANTRGLTIALDVDGCLQDCNTYVHALAEGVLDRKLPPVNEHRHFEFDQSLQLTKSEWRAVRDAIMDNHPTAAMDWLPGATAFVDTLLLRGFDVFFLTSHWRGHDTWVTHREQRLQNLWPQCDVVFTHKKSRCQFDLLLDDKPENLSGLGERGVLFSQPWNAESGLFRVRSYAEFLELVSPKLKA